MRHTYTLETSQVDRIRFDAFYRIHFYESVTQELIKTLHTREDTERAFAVLFHITECDVDDVEEAKCRAWRQFLAVVAQTVVENS